MSESKETESGAEDQKVEGAAETEGTPSESAEGTEASAAEGEAGEPAEATEESPKKKKKKAREAEPEAIKDRNARVRAEAAEKRRSRREREQGGAAPRRNLDASEVMDDALARSTHAAAGFITKNFNKVQWVILAGLVGWIGWEVYSWRHDRDAEKATAALLKALSAETGKVGADGGPDDRTGLSDTRRSFATDEERLKATKAEYVLASSAVGSKASILTEFGAAGAAYDLGQYKEAQSGFEKVKQHPSFGADVDLKGRTLEGLGMTLEALKDDDGALKAFKELQNLDSANFSALGMYHQARILKAQGKNEDAIKLLDKAGEKLVSVKDNQGTIKYLRVSIMELFESLDAKKARELGTKLMPADMMKQLGEGVSVGPGGSQKLSPEKIQELINQMQKNAPAQGAPPADAPPTDAPPTDAAPAEPTPPLGPLAPIPDAPAPAPSGGQ